MEKKMDKRFLEHTQPPASATKKIFAGRLKGMTDIKPQWRIEALTHTYGLCGIGWYYNIIEHWTENLAEVVTVHVRINLFIKDGEMWSKPIEGIGGSTLVAKEKRGPYHSDEAYKMATTDAISVACKMIGIGHNVYMGYSDSKYVQKPDYMSDETRKDNFDEIKNLMKETGKTEEHICKYFKVSKLESLTDQQKAELLELLRKTKASLNGGKK